MTREAIEARPRNLWRYRELLPITGEPRTGFTSGFTPLVRADRLAARLGVSELYVKDDGVNHPTLSYKDRVVSVAATRAVELGFTVFGCASTGNLGNSVAAHAARLGLDAATSSSRTTSSRARSSARRIYQPTLMADPRQLRRREPALHADRRQVRLGLRQHQPAHLLRRGRQDVRLRDRRAARLAAARSTSSRPSPAARCCRASPAASASCARSASSTATAEDLRGAGRGLRAGRPGAARRRRSSGSGEARHDRQVDRHRQPGRRLPGDRGAEGDRRLGRDGHRRRDPSTASTCWPRPKASSPSPPAARRSRSRRS